MRNKILSLPKHVNDFSNNFNHFDTMDIARLKNIANAFQINASIERIIPLGAGLINDTYKVETQEEQQPDYVLQRINHAIFKDVATLMHNIVAVTNHIRGKLEANKEVDIERKVLTFISLRNSQSYYYVDSGNYWRLMRYIPRTVTKTEVSVQTSFEVGNAFGQFQSMLVDLPEALGETIPNFHNMEFRLLQLNEAIRGDVAGRVTSVTDLIDELQSRSQAMCLAERLHRQGLLPKRVCHCDTKIDNILFDETGQILCVIDLDTVMPNYVFSDVGDFMRTAANIGKEDERNLDKVDFNLAIFKSFIDGYLQTADSFLLPIEIENLPYAAALFPYMQAVRFLTDYLNGDAYYKIQYPEHNLVRARAQLKLLQCVERDMTAMQTYVNAYL